MRLEVTYPLDEAITSSPVRFKFNVKSSESTKSQFSGMFVCVELEGVESQCSLVLDMKIIFQDLPEGNYVARAYMFDGAVRYHETDPLSFVVLNARDFDAHIDHVREQLRIDNHFPLDLNILQWAQQYQSAGQTTTQNTSVVQSSALHSDDLLLVIGIKTAVLTNFAQRQAIRETWASHTALPVHVKVFFLGCTPVVDSVSDSLHRQRIQDAVNLERDMYGDLLTEELECDDKYTLLAEKVSAFFEWIVAEFPSTKFVMVTDDDAYVRVDKVVAKLNENIPSEGLYIGELLDALHPSPLSPVRDPTHPYYTSRKSYPLQQFPPYASGPHYLVSMDCVRFVGKNRYRLASLGGDDMSVGLWLLVIQVHVQYSAAFASMRLWPCKDKLLSFADLSPLGIRSIHSNLLTTRRFCHNFDHIIGVIDGLLLWKTYLIHSRSPFLTKLATQQGMESVNYSEIHNFQQSSINTVITINCSTTKKYLQSTRMRIKVLFSWLLWGVCSVSPIHDSITGFRLVYPTDGSIETIPLEFRTEISVDSIEEYKYQYRDKVLCIELQGLLKKEKCSPLMDPSVIFDALPPGNYTARAFITSTGGDIQYYATSDTVFTVVSKETLAAMMTRKIPEEQGLIEWAVQRRGTFGSLMKQKMGNYDERDVINNRVKHSTSILTNSDILLVIGVKTAVIKNFALRQAIRETWGSANVIPHDVKVFFVGCVPTLTNNLTNDERQQIQQAIELEKLTYGDLLTDELRCEDSYGNLPNKVKEFLHFASYTFPHTPFVMVADDDIYLRVDRLVDELRKQQPSQRLYIGQVWDALLGRRQEPVRETTERYYIPQARYPLHTYPPFAFGPHYLLSMDCARFIAKNSDKLRGLGAMDDVSVALWLLTIQVHVEHTLAFSSLRIATCKNSLLSLADLSSFGIRSIHENLVEKRGLCYGFDRMGWLK